MKAMQPDFRIACTGTPVENRLLDLWNIFDTVQPGLLGSAKDFSQAYERQGTQTYAGLKSRLLYQRPNAFLLRRSKGDVRVVNGDTPRAGSLRKNGVGTRSGILEEFRTSEGFDILILSPFVAGVGLTIVEANHVIHYGRWWNPAVEAQATDRAYRLGQLKEVHVYIPILEDKTRRVTPTFDQLLDQLMESKKGLAEGALQRDEFLQPKEREEDAGLQVFSGLQASANL